MLKSECECGIIWQNRSLGATEMRDFIPTGRLFSMEPHEVFVHKEVWLAEQETRREGVPGVQAWRREAVSMAGKAGSPVCKCICFRGQWANPYPSPGHQWRRITAGRSRKKTLITGSDQQRSPTAGGGQDPWEALIPEIWGRRACLRLRWDQGILPQPGDQALAVRSTWNLPLGEERESEETTFLKCRQGKQ